MIKKKILVFHPALAPYRVDFFNALNNAFNANFYFNLTNAKSQKFDQEALKKKSEFNCNYLEKGFELLGRSFRFGVISIIKKCNPDIILCSEYGSVTCVVVFFVKVFNKNIKIYTISDDSLANSKDRKGIRAFLRKIILKNIDGAIFTNEEVSNWHNMNVSHKLKTLNLPIIHNDVVFREYLMRSVAKANQNIVKYNLKGKKVLLYVGRLVKVKNLEFLINCFSKVENEDVSLILVGDGIIKLKLKQQIEELNISEKIHFIGRQEEEALYNWYVFSHIFILPSIYEPFGAVVNEALIGGAYTLCSSYAGASSLINESNGDLFNPRKEYDLIEKLQAAISNSSKLESEIVSLRESKMTFEFNSMINKLIGEL